jgi:ABC-type Fe3+/spermidine/putrescine transport system ATPase subunit
VPQLSLVNVTKKFGKVLAVDRLSLEVSDGEYLCVLGPTGSGKTTLLKLMAGLLKPDEGAVNFDGKPVNEVNVQDRNAVYVPQHYALFPHFTVLQNVAFGPLARGKPASVALEIASKALDLVRLSSRAQALPSELSGGMQQRVALARGLASGARLLLLDEPLSAIDARLRLDLRHKIRDLVKQSGITAIHVTHDQDEAMTVGDEIMVLRNGRVQDFGPPRRVYRRPTGIFVANMIGGASFFEGIVDSTVGETALINARGLVIQAPSHTLTLTSPVILGLRKERVRISSDRPPMDNVFRGEIRSMRFLGNSREYLVRLSNGDTIASRQFSEIKPMFTIGEEVLVSFLESDVMVFEYPVQGLSRELEIA